MKLSNRELDRKLSELGFVLVRSKNHSVYRHTSGQNLIVSKSSSDERMFWSVRRDVNRILNRRVL